MPDANVQHNHARMKLRWKRSGVTTQLGWLLPAFHPALPSFAIAPCTTYPLDRSSSVK